MNLDVRYAIRTLRTRPGFAAAVVGTLALGIGASTAMFSIVDAALLRRLPFDDPDRLVVLWGVAGPARDVRGASIPEATDWAQQNRSLTAMSLYDETALDLQTADGAIRVDAEMVSPSYFPLLGVRAARGRVFIAEEDRAPDANPVVLISDRLWRERFGADQAIVGRPITLNDRALEVVGIMPPGFSGLSFDTDVWFPSMMVSLTRRAATVEQRETRWLMGLGRLRPGGTLATAQLDFDRVAGRLREAYPQTNADRGVQVIPLREGYLGNTRTLLLVVFASVLVFLLIACANVTSLQLVRATARRREIAVRLALGARRSRLVRQLLTESMLLALLGGAAGTLLAQWSVDAIRPFLPDGLLPGYAEVALDGRVLLFSLAIAIATGLVCGIAPALISARQNLADALRDGARAGSAGLGRIRRPGAQQVLVGTEVALALMLLIGAGLMGRTLQRQLAVSPGFDPRAVVTARVTLPARYAPEQRMRFAEDLVETLRALPGVSSASVSSDIPLTGRSSASVLELPGSAATVRYFRHYVTPGFFTTLGIPIVRGRGFTDRDVRGSNDVVILGEAAARRLFPGADPVGQTLPLRTGSVATATVIGIARDARFRDLTTDLAAPGAEPDIYFPYAQRSDPNIEIAVRSRTEALVPDETLRTAVATLDPTLPLFQVAPLTQSLHRQTAVARFGSLLLAAFSTVALALAAIGLHGVISFVVGLSRREIAIRMALGAEGAAVRRLVVRNAMTLVSAGVVAGLVVAMLLSHLLGDLLFAVGPRDPFTFVAVAVMVLAIAFVASWLPARHAARIEPNTALKSE